MSSGEKNEATERDWYAVLNVPIGSSKEVIGKAARKLGLKYHPDKTNDPNDHAMFLLVQRAKDILCDDEKRKEIDEKLKAAAARSEYEKQREQGMDNRRKRMREELEEKLKKAENRGSEGGKRPAPTHEGKDRRHSNVHQKQQQEEMKRKADEIERLRKEGLSRLDASSREMGEKSGLWEKEFMKKQMEMRFEEDTSTPSTVQVKVKWKRSRQSHSDESLYQLFKVFGPIQDVTLTGDSGNAAIITFESETAANNAIDAYVDSNEYRVTLIASSKVKKPAAVFTHVYSNKPTTRYSSSLGAAFDNILRSSASSSSSSSSSSSFSASSRSLSTHDAELLSTLRRAVERETILRSEEEGNQRDAEIEDPSSKWNADLRDNAGDGKNGDKIFPTAAQLNGEGGSLAFPVLFASILGTSVITSHEGLVSREQELMRKMTASQ